MHEVSIHQSHIYGQIKILQRVIKMGHQRNIPVKYFKIGQKVPEEKILKELLKEIHFVTMAIKVFDRIKCCEQIFKKNFPRNIPAKFGPNWPSGLGGEDVYRNC